MPIRLLDEYQNPPAVASPTMSDVADLPDVSPARSNDLEVLQDEDPEGTVSSHRSPPAPLKLAGLLPTPEAVAPQAEKARTRRAEAAAEAALKVNHNLYKPPRLHSKAKKAK